jgi:prepilin-type N-terminal cleavage/methylation domain-containing protein
MFSCATDEKQNPGALFPGRQTVAGFTLAEILVAISIFAVLVSIVLGSLTFMLSKASSIKEGITTYEEVRTCLDRISTDLSCIYVSVEPGYQPPGIDDDPDPYRFVCEAPQGEGAWMEFTAFSHLPLGGGVPSGIGHIMYYLHETDQDGQVLMRRDTTLATADKGDRFDDSQMGMDPILCRHVKTFSIICFDEEGTAFESWDSDSGDFSNATPIAVRVRIEIAGEQTVYPFETTISLHVFRKKAPHAQ